MPAPLNRRIVFPILATMLFTDVLSWCQETEIAAVGPPAAVSRQRVPRKPMERHPLAPALTLAHKQLDQVRQNVQDYTCLLIKRERIGGKLLPLEQIRVKCRPRHRRGGTWQPFSVYMKYLAPKAYRGREVLYVDGRDRGKMLVRKGGGLTGFLTFWLEPDGSMAMRTNRHPITEFGLEPLLTRLIEIGEHDLDFAECEVRDLAAARIGQRDCSGLEVRHPVARAHFQFHRARIFWDNAWQVPIHFEMYDWPVQSDEPAPLVELYSFQDLRLNVGLTDRDFDPDNPDYGFGGADRPTQ